MIRGFKNQAGFTLIEILIVVVLLGIMATILVPKISVSSDEAKLNSLKTNLTTIRGAIRLYFNQHDNTFPGVHDDKGQPAANAAQAAKGFNYQLFRYTDLNGDSSKTKDATYKFGPYLKASELPINPFTNDNTLECDITTTDVSDRTSDGSSGWKFYTKTGILIANDGAHNDL